MVTKFVFVVIVMILASDLGKNLNQISIRFVILLNDGDGSLVHAYVDGERGMFVSVSRYSL